MNLKFTFPLKPLARGLALAAILSASIHAHAQTITWTGPDGDFFDASGWDSKTVPGLSETALIDNGKTVTIPSTTGEFKLGAFTLGSVEGSDVSGHVIMNGGVLILGAESGDAKSIIGNGATRSTFIMNGGQILFDGPDQFPGNASKAGVNNLDWEVGEKGVGRFEMHNNAIFRAGDDLKIAENAAGSGSCLIDGNAIVSLGSGLSISSGGENEQVMVIAGNALVEAGNSMGAGNPLGSQDEGYLTLAIGGGRANLTLQDNAVLNIRVLSSRAGTTRMTVKNNAQFHIFDVFTGKGFINAQTPPDRPEVTGGFNSTLSSEAPSDSVLILQDNAQMTVNAAAGLGLSAPRASGSATGGTALMTIRDSASFRVEQQLAIGAGAQAATSDGALEVVGPNAKIFIGGNLNLAVDPDGIVPTTDLADDQGAPLPGKAAIKAVITSAAHSTITVGGTARLDQGILKVKLDGFTPAGGEIFTLVKAASVEGPFRETDFSEAPLPAGLKWEPEYAADAVRLKIAGQVVGPRIVTVTTTDNVNPPQGALSLLQALASLEDGDEIRFNIPGNGPHYILTPPQGYPLITKNNVVIDGYSQPGAAPNTNPILAPNNAQIKIILDSRNGNHRVMNFPPVGPNDQTGYGDSEAAILGILEAKGFNARGLAFLGVPLVGAGNDIALYSISFAKGASGHVNGCWIGVDVDGATLAGTADGVTGFRYRVRDENNQVLEDILTNDVIVGAKPRSPNPVSEFNVIVGPPAIPVIIEGNNTRISGNFLGVFPSGLRDYNPALDPAIPPGTFEGAIELGRGNNNVVIGTDGDGVNDANERNIIGGTLPPSLGGYDHTIEFYGNTPGTNIVIAGNYIGVGIDGATFFTNGVPPFNAAGASAQTRFGSDFNGVSDSLEGNFVVNNHPAATFPPSEFASTPANLNFFSELNAGGVISFRGNTLINNFPAPVSPLRAEGQFLIDYMSKALSDAAAGVTPVLAAATSFTRLIGTAPRANTDYPTVAIDVYIADPDGIATGQAAGIEGLPQGFVQGRVYLGSFVMDGPQDRNPAAGAFEFDISGLNIPAGASLTVTANYSKPADAAGRIVTLTGPFSNPVAPTGSPASKTISIRRDGARLAIEFTGVLQTAPAVNGPWTDVAGNPASPFTIEPAALAGAAFFRTR